MHDEDYRVYHAHDMKPSKARVKTSLLNIDQDLRAISRSLAGISSLINFKQTNDKHEESVTVSNEVKEEMIPDEIFSIVSQLFVADTIKKIKQQVSKDFDDWEIKNVNHGNQDEEENDNLPLTASKRLAELIDEIYVLERPGNQLGEKAYVTYKFPLKLVSSIEMRTEPTHGVTEYFLEAYFEDEVKEIKISHLEYETIKELERLKNKYKN